MKRYFEHTVTSLGKCLDIMPMESFGLEIEFKNQEDDEEENDRENKLPHIVIIMKL